MNSVRSCGNFFQCDRRAERATRSREQRGRSQTLGLFLFVEIFKSGPVTLEAARVFHVAQADLAGS